MEGERGLWWLGEKMELTVIENKEYNIYNNVKKYILEGKNETRNRGTTH